MTDRRSIALFIFSLCILFGCRLALTGFEQGRWFIAVCGLGIVVSCSALAWGVYKRQPS